MKETSKTRGRCELGVVRYKMAVAKRLKTRPIVIAVGERISAFSRGSLVHLSGAKYLGHMVPHAGLARRLDCFRCTSYKHQQLCLVIFT